jgi:hypothetical protein
MSEVRCPALLAEVLVQQNRGVLERCSVPNPQYARESLKLARALELHDDQPSEHVSWLVDYLSNCEGAGSR